MTPRMWRGLAEIGRSLPADIRVVVVRGAGPSFSSGIDLRILAGEGADEADRVPSPADPGFEDWVASCQEGFAWLRSPSLICDRGGSRPRHRCGVPACSWLRPAGARRRRDALHERAVARPGARPYGDKATCRHCGPAQGPGDLPHRAFRAGRRGARAAPGRAGGARGGPGRRRGRPCCRAARRGPGDGPGHQGASWQGRRQHPGAAGGGRTPGPGGVATVTAPDDASEPTYPAGWLGTS